MKLSPQYLVVVNLLLLALAAYSAASIVDTLIAGRMMPKPQVVLSAKPPPPEPQPPKDLAFYKRVAERDIFNSAPPPVAAAPVERPSSPSAPPRAPTPARAASGAFTGTH